MKTIINWKSNAKNYDQYCSVKYQEWCTVVCSNLSVTEYAINWNVSVAGSTYPKCRVMRVWCERQRMAARKACAEKSVYKSTE